MFTKKSGLFLISLLLIMGCASLKPLLPVPTEVSTPLPSAPAAAATLEQIPTVATIPPTLTSDLPSINVSTQIPPTPEFPWNIYHSDTYGFSFAYPSAYDEPQYQTCSPRVVEQPDGAEFSYLYFPKLDGAAREAFIQQMSEIDPITHISELIHRSDLVPVWEQRFPHPQRTRTGILWGCE